MALMCNGNLVQFVGKCDGQTTSFQTKSGEKGAKLLQFKRFRFGISGLRSSVECMQFSNLKFVSNNGFVFKYSSNDEDSASLKREIDYKRYWSDTGTPGQSEEGDHGNESLVHGLMGTGNKCCIDYVNIPKYSKDQNKLFYLEYALDKNNLNGKCLDVSVFNKWYFYTANDFSGRDPMQFQLELFDHIENKWKIVDSFNAAYKGEYPSTRHTLAYNGNITLK